MNVAIVSEQLCYPPNTGGRIRTLNLMRRMARRHRITYLCHAAEDDAVNQEAIRQFSQDNIECLMVSPVPDKKRGAYFYLGLALNLLSRQPYAVASHNSPHLRAAIRQVERTQTIDLWQFEWLAYADALRYPATAKTLVVAPNIESIIWQRYCEVERRPFHRWYLRKQLEKFVRIERRLFSSSTVVIAVSRSDAEIARNQFMAKRVQVVENGVDGAYFAECRADRDTNRILFLGSLDWRPNLDAVKLLLDQIFPAVLAQHPDAKLCIVGRSPPQWLRDRVKSLPQVELHPDVPDVRAFLATSGVMTVPLRIGGGTRLKILEALACGLPVISSSIGSEGLELAAGNEFIIADGCQEMAEAIVQTLRDPVTARETAQRGRATVLARFDWDALAEKLERVWVDVTQNKIKADHEFQAASAIQFANR